MTPEQQGLIEDIAVRFAAAAPPGWDTLDVDVSMLTSISGFAATATDASGTETPFFIDDSTDKKILRALGKLREDMAAENGGRGAWYVLSLHIPHGRKPSVDFDYYSKPTFGVHVGDGAYKQDLKRFPRSEEHLPEWLGGKFNPGAVKKPKPAPTPNEAAPIIAPAVGAVTAADSSNTTSDESGTTITFSHNQGVTDVPSAAKAEPIPGAAQGSDTYQDPLFAEEPQEAEPTEIDLNAPSEPEPQVSAEAPVADDGTAIDIPQDEQAVAPSGDALFQPEATEAFVEPAVEPELAPDSPDAEVQSVAESIKAAAAEPQPQPPAPIDPANDTPWWDNPNPGDEPDTEQPAASDPNTPANS